MNWIDKAITYFSPEAGAKRAMQREIISDIERTEAAREDARAEYQGYSTGRTSTPYPDTYGQNPFLLNGGLRRNLQALRDKSRNLIDNNAIASGILNRAVTNIVGPQGF